MKNIYKIFLYPASLIISVMIGINTYIKIQRGTWDADTFLSDILFLKSNIGYIAITFWVAILTIIYKLI